METRHHHIGKLVVDLKLDANEEAEKLQGAFRGSFEKKLMEALDVALTGFSSNGHLFIIEQLELDLGAIHLDDFPHALSQKIAASLRSQISENKAGREGGNIVRISARQINTAILLAFLKNGHLPWWAPQESLSGLEQKLLKEKSVFDKTFRNKFASLLNSPAVQKRLASQFSGRFVTQLLLSLRPAVTNNILEIKSKIDRLIKQNYPAAKIDDSVGVSLLIRLIAAQGKPATISRIFTVDYISKLAERSNIDEKVIINLLPENLGIKQEGNKRNERMLKNQHITEDEDIIPKNSDEVMIENAGLVIFWPFLQQLFSALNLTDRKGFINPEKQERAVLLLQFLVTGTTAASEHLLPLNKLLCGYPIHRPVIGKIEIEAKEQNELESLLKAVIAHWTALKNTSADALRETFVQRSGILSYSDDGFHLKVERRGVDILRDRLPWSLALIKLPWMHKKLNVEW